MKLAPNLKKQPHDKMTEVIIFAGSDAWAHAKQWQEQDGRLAGDNVPPVWLGDSQLDELADLKIIDDGRYCVRLYKAGHIKEQPNAIRKIAQMEVCSGNKTMASEPITAIHAQIRMAFAWSRYFGIKMIPQI